MKKTLLILTIALISFNCSVQRIKKNNSKKGVGIAHKTANPNTPYIYKNGYLNYDILKIPVSQKNDTIYVNQLRFNAVLSAMYTKKAMYERYGIWTKEIRPNNESHPILVWENVKLFDNEGRTFTIYANGNENWNEIYASVLVFDNNKRDGLSEDYPDKNRIINFFSNSIKNLNDKNDFYDIYWTSVNEYIKKTQKK